MALLKTFCRYGERMFINDLRNLLEKPLGPGDFLFGKVLVTDSILGAVNGALSSWRCESEREGKCNSWRNCCWSVGVLRCPFVGYKALHNNQQTD